MPRAKRPTIKIHHTKKPNDSGDLPEKAPPPTPTPPSPTSNLGSGGKQNLGFLEIRVRPPKPEDWNYILDSWKRSFKETLKWVPGEIFFPHLTARIETIRQRRETIFRVACDPDDEDFIFGCACLGRNSLVHYAFTRHAFRRADVAKRITGISSTPTTVTHWTRICEKVNRKHPGLLIYEPSKL